jgi:hypothetical protein
MCIFLRFPLLLVPQQMEIKAELFLAIRLFNDYASDAF